MLVIYAVTGYRQGILVSTLSLVGFLGGGMLGMWLLPSLLANVEWVTSNEVIRVLALVFLVFLCATVGQAIAVPVGNRLRAHVPVRPWTRSSADWPRSSRSPCSSGSWRGRCAGPRRRRWPRRSGSPGCS